MWEFTLARDALFLLCLLLIGCADDIPDQLIFSQAQLSNSIIAFSSNRDGRSGIYVMNTDGTNQTRLSPLDDYQPSWSPDGKRIVFVSSDSSGRGEIFVINADGTNRIQLTNNTSPDLQPSWLPDGKKIAFFSYRDGRSGIYVMNADGTNQTQLTDPIRSSGDSTHSQPSWSPDGTKIAFHLTSVDWIKSGIYVMNADGTNRIQLTNPPVNSYDSTLSWSPDGTKIAFSRSSSRNDKVGGIYVMNTDGTNQTQLTDNGVSPSWSPDGTKIAFSRQSGSKGHQIYVMNTDGTNQTQLTYHNSNNCCPSWSPFLTAISSQPP